MGLHEREIKVRSQRIVLIANPRSSSRSETFALSDPGSLAEQWQDELRDKFDLRFEITTNEGLDRSLTLAAT